MSTFKFAANTNSPPDLSLEEMEVLWSETGRPEKYVFNPLSMVERAEGFKSLHEWLLSVMSAPKSDFIDWSESIGYSDLGCENQKEAFEMWETLADDGFEVWLEALAAEYKHQNGREFDISSLDEDEYELFSSFLKEPSNSAACTHRLLREIAGVVEIVNTSKAHYLALFAQQCLRDSQKSTVLWSEIEPSEGLAGKVANLELWVHITADTNNIEIESPWVQIFSAVLVDVGADGKAKLVGAMYGEYVLGYMAGTCLEGGFYDVMDAHSAMLNDVWKVIVGELMPEHDETDIGEFLEMSCEDYPDACRSGIAVPLIFVPPEYRGVGVSLELLYGCTRLTVDAKYTNFYQPRNRRGHTIMNPDAYDDMLDDVGDESEEGFETSPMTIYILQVEGTRPQEMVANPFRAMDLTKEPKSKVVNATVEKKRRKLVNYFSKIGDESDEFILKCYDPWEYPIT